MLVDRLDLTACEHHERVVKIRHERRGQPPALGLGELMAPEFFRHGHLGRTRVAVARQHEAFERQGGRAQRLGETKRERATGKHFARGIARARRIGRGELQLGGVQRARRIPERGGAALGKNFQPVMPRPLAHGTKCCQAFLIKIEDQTGFVGQAREFHEEVV